MRTYLAALSLLLMVGCDTHEKKPRAEIKQDMSSLANVSNDQSTLNPFERNESQADRILTQQIRQLIMQDEQLSTNAKNIKIITIDGVVNLSGNTTDPSERMIIIEKIRSVPGIKNIKDHIEENNFNNLED